MKNHRRGAHCTELHQRSPETAKGSAMRYSSDRKEKTRARIIDAASKAFRQYGYHATGVDRVMEEAGLTAGAFYAHFPSREALFAAAFSQAASQKEALKALLASKTTSMS